MRRHGVDVLAALVLGAAVFSYTGASDPIYTKAAGMPTCRISGIALDVGR